MFLAYASSLRSARCQRRRGSGWTTTISRRHDDSSARDTTRGLMLTMKDWIARAAADAATAADSLAQAEVAARYPGDWVDLATAWLAHGDPEQARRCIAVTLDRAQGDHWAVRNAASFLLEQLADRGGAEAALDGLAVYLTASTERRRTSYWIMLGAAYRGVLSDERRMRSAVEQAAAVATSASDLAELARGYHDLLADAAAARDALERAQEVAITTGELRELWGVANAWNAVGDPAGARAALMLGTTKTTEVRDLTAFATAWRSLFDDEAGVRAALVRAETLATTATHWLDIAEEYFDGGTDNRTVAWDPDGVRRGLEASLAAALTDEDRAKITAGYRDWLGISAATAAGLAPAMHAPEQVLAAVRTLEGWDRSYPRALLDRLRERLTPGRLEAIAKADWGTAWTKHHRVLVEIHETGLVPVQLQWHPLEALELYRWTQGADTDHELRAFACAVLAFDAVIPSTGQCGDIGNVIAPLLESAWALGLDDPLEATLVWLAEVARQSEVVWPLFGLILARARRDPDDPRLGALVAALVAAEAEASVWHTWSEHWLFRTSNHDSYHPLWRVLAAESLARAPASAAHLVELRDRMR